MKLLQFNQLGDSIGGLKESFDNLPHTNHKDGKYRLRRYSTIELRTSFWNAKEEAVIERLEHGDFKQSEDYNKHQGGIARSFEEIEESTLQSEGMKEICLAFKNGFELIGGQEIEIHQMRVITQEDGTARVSPEGVHQDGFNYISMIGVSRSNAQGGELLLYEGKNSEPFMRRALKDGEMVMIRDDELWHNATPIAAKTHVIDQAKEAYADWFILCAKNNN
ncbi:agglutination protein [Candidatus Pacearchaeota archaeon]|nr:agglutination protein [Candidatus Pacearchaeota archaeon]|tara:strand:- start:2063 stop:2725 length:663 start_codon:yes stop_codon:yes gene_type:complete